MLSYSIMEKYLISLQKLLQCFFFRKACLYLIILDSCTGKLAVVNNVIKQQFIYCKKQYSEKRLTPFRRMNEYDEIILFQAESILWFRKTPSIDLMFSEKIKSKWSFYKVVWMFYKNMRKILEMKNQQTNQDCHLQH